MCGIVAALDASGSKIAPSLINAMMTVQIHRGPDDSGSFFEKNLAFGFRRLAIVDLTPAGHQPMTDIEKRITLVFNGEIYNHRALRDDLVQRGFSFRSRCDTEVLLNAWLAWGFDCLPRLNGMFAFIVYDHSTNQIFGARDRFGVKPLYLSRCGSHILFASEIKAILASGKYFKKGPQWDVAFDYLSAGKFDSTNTFFPGISALSAGYAFELNLEGSLIERRWWSTPTEEPYTGGDEIERFREIFDDAVRLRLHSDVPVGVSLSGGLDSTSIACSMYSSIHKRRVGENSSIKALCFQSDQYNERAYIEDTRDMCNLSLIDIAIDESQIYSLMNKVLQIQDEPFHSLGPLVQYELLRVARSVGLVVLLSGQGADEYCAGYSPYFRIYWKELLRGFHVRQAAKEIVDYATLHNGSFSSIFSERLIAVLKDFLYRQSLLLQRISTQRSEQYRFAKRWFSSDFIGDKLSGPREWRPASLRESLAHSIEVDPLPLYLRVDDRNSMAHSIEVRSPFLDFRLVSMVLGMDDNWKLKGGWNKRIIREAGKGRVPKSVIERIDKMGFPVPEQCWFNGTLSKVLRDFICDRAFRERGIYNADVIQNDLDAYLDKPNDKFLPPFIRLLLFESWMRQHFD